MMKYIFSSVAALCLLFSLAAAQSDLFTIQVGAFRSEAAATRLVNQLKLSGADAYYFKAAIPGKGDFYRVRVGRFRTHSQAREMSDQLRRTGLAKNLFITRYEGASSNFEPGRSAARATNHRAEARRSPAAAAPLPGPLSARARVEKDSHLPEASFIQRADPQRQPEINSTQSGQSSNTTLQQTMDDLRSRASSQPSSPASKPDPERQELLKKIEQLEERLQKLEAEKSAKKDAQPPSLTPAETAPTTETQEPQAKPATSATFLNSFKPTEVSGFIDVYYSYNFNQPTGRANQLRNFDTNSNQFSLNLVKLALEKKNTAQSRLGYRLDLTFGPATDLVHASEPGRAEVYKHLQQFYGSYLVPVGKGLQIDVGKFVTSHGAEVIETKDNWNYARSLLFVYAIPYYHLGVRAKYELNSQVSVTGFLVNGWNNCVDNNSGKTVGLQVAYNPTSEFSIVSNYMVGPEQSNQIGGFRHLIDTTVTYKVSPKLAFMGNYDYGRDELPGGNRVHWQGVAGYVHFAPISRLAFASRVEWFDDHDGYTTGLKQRLKELTLTSDFRFHPSVLFRVEYRRDFSDRPFFDQSDPVIKVKSQATLLAGLIFILGGENK
jgi:hypothetical protein